MRLGLVKKWWHLTSESQSLRLVSHSRIPFRYSTGGSGGMTSKTLSVISQLSVENNPRPPTAQLMKPTLTHNHS